MTYLTLDNIELDEEYLLFREWITEQDKAKATVKSYLASFRRLRNILGKEIHNTAETTLIKAVEVEVENKNTQSALINVAILLRKQIYEMPFETLEKKRQENKGAIQENLKQNNRYIILPSITEFDEHINTLFREKKYMEFIINYLIRNVFVRNQDLIFTVVDTRKETGDKSKNYMLFERKKKQVTFIRNVYKTANTYGSKETLITDPEFIVALRATRDKFPITDSESKIGYWIQRDSFQQLGESALLKVIINAYKGDINMLKRISENRGTNLETLLTSYNITFVNET